MNNRLSKLVRSCFEGFMSLFDVVETILENVVMKCLSKHRGGGELKGTVPA